MPSVQEIVTVAQRMVQVGGHVAWEKLGGYRPQLAGDIPQSAAAISPQWLSAVLCRDHAGAQVLAVEQTGSSAGTSSRVGLALQYNAAGQQAGLPTRLFAKMTSLWSQRLVLGLAGVIQGETGFYSQVRPRLQIEAPQSYFAAYDPDSWRSVILMEDIVSSKGVSFCKPMSAVSREDMQDLLANMAAWHGAFWNSPMFERELSWLMTPQQFRARIAGLINMQKRSLIGAQRAESVFPKALFPRQKELWAAYGRSFEMLSKRPLTFLHGDSHIGNTYRTRDGRMGFTDWQVVQKGGWAYDFAYIVTTGLRIEDRRAWEGELLRFYLDRLAAAGAPAPSFDEAWLTYRRSTLYPYYAWVYTIGAGSLQPDMQPRDICLLNIERTSHAIEDLDSLKALSN